MNEETKKASLNHIQTNINYIRGLMQKSKTIAFDWRYDIEQSLVEIETELSSWKEHHAPKGGIIDE